MNIQHLQSAAHRERDYCDYLRAPRSVNPETARDTKCLLRSQPRCLLPQQSVPAADILLRLQEATNTLLQTTEGYTVRYN